MVQPQTGDPTGRTHHPHLQHSDVPSTVIRMNPSATPRGGMLFWPPGRTKPSYSKHTKQKPTNKPTDQQTTRRPAPSQRCAFFFFFSSYRRSSASEVPLSARSHVNDHRQKQRRSRTVCQQHWKRRKRKGIQSMMCDLGFAVKASVDHRRRKRQHTSFIDMESAT